jgi:oligoribonuclease NrnB/cAMP/cGMP phosphodiesterase (DHH superfamily)
MLITDGISGMALTYMKLFERSFVECPQYIKLVSDYDCWKKEYPESDFFELGLTADRYDPLSGVWDELFSEEVLANSYAVGRTRDCLVNQGKTIDRYLQNNYEEYCKNFGFESEIDGFPCFVVNRKCSSKIFGDRISKYPVCVSYAFDGNVYSYTLFSSKESGDIDCSFIAKHNHGGGGHKNAAGFTSKDFLFNKKEG